MGSALTGILLEVGGFISSEGGAAVTQPDSALMMMKVLMGIVPAVLFAVVLVTMKFYDVEKKLPEMQAELDARHAGRSAE